MFACISMCVRMVYVGDTAYTCEHTCRVQRKTSEVLGFHYFLETVSLAGPGIRFDSQQAPMIHMFSSPTPVGLQAGAMYSVLHMGDGIQSQVYRLPKSASALIHLPSPQPTIARDSEDTWAGNAGLASKHGEELSYGSLLS